MYQASDINRESLSHFHLLVSLAYKQLAPSFMMASYSEQNSVELQVSNRSLSASRTNDFGPEQASENVNTEVEVRSLPPIDHGKQAYLVLAGCTLIQAPVWGNAVLMTNSSSPLTFFQDIPSPLESFKTTIPTVKISKAHLDKSPSSGPR
jgi:hypothetical protein